MQQYNITSSDIEKAEEFALFWINQLENTKYERFVEVPFDTLCSALVAITAQAIAPGNEIDRIKENTNHSTKNSPRLVDNP